jgi:methylated-DNA-[protein]-cysteine S-methyltransferase
VTTQTACFNLPVAGWSVQVRASATALLGVDFVHARADEARITDPLLAEAIAQIRHYCDDPATAFDLPLAPRGTPFQRRVWKALQALRPGETRSYGELARQLGTSPRAVGGACRANPYAIVVPCHRIVSMHGPGGFSGAVSGPELKIKQWLLNHEDKAARREKRPAAA